jgi:hypothetical protein
MSLCPSGQIIDISHSQIDCDTLMTKQQFAAVEQFGPIMNARAFLEHIESMAFLFFVCG